MGCDHPAGGDVGQGAAQSLGHVQRVCGPDESLEECTDAFLAPLLSRPVQVLRAFKALALESRLALHDRLATLEEGGFTTTWVHEDHWAAAERALAPRS